MSFLFLFLELLSVEELVFNCSYQSVLILKSVESTTNIGNNRNKEEKDKQRCCSSFYYENPLNRGKKKEKKKKRILMIIVRAEANPWYRLEFKYTEG